MKWRILVAVLAAATMATSVGDAQAKPTQISGESVMLIRVHTDPNGATHSRYERTYRGFPVLGGDFIVHTTPDGRPNGVTDNLAGPLNVDEHPRITASSAVSAAVAALHGVVRTLGEPRLVVDATSGYGKLAWETVLTSRPNNERVESTVHVLTDATNGENLYSWRDEESVGGAGHSIYSGDVAVEASPWLITSYQLTDNYRGGTVTCDANHTTNSCSRITSPDNEWGDGTNNDPQSAAVDAHYGVAAAYDYYDYVLGRDGIDGKGSGTKVRVHYADKLKDALWNYAAKEIRLGDGIDNARPITSLDVVAHEFTHGVTQAELGIPKGGEPAALSEATSDIIGTMVEIWNYNEHDPPDYLIAEAVNINGDGKPLRYMFNPALDGVSDNCWTAGTKDHEIHHAAGVANHFFFMLAEGSGHTAFGDSPTCGGEPTVSGISRGRAVQIWYRALTRYMLSTTSYVNPAKPSNSIRSATLHAAADLYGKCSSEYRAVHAAWTAVHVRGVDTPCDGAATIAWTYPLDPTGEYIAYPDGSVTVVHIDCNQTNVYRTLDRDSNNIGTLQSPGCGRFTQPGPDGIFYGEIYYPATDQYHLAAMRAEKILWNTPIPDYGCHEGSPSYAFWLSPTANGDLHAMLDARDPDCTQRQTRFLGLAARDGTIRTDQRVVANSIPKAYDQGIVYTYLDTLYRRAYTGELLGTTPMGFADMAWGDTAATTNGRYISALYRNDTPSEECRSGVHQVIAAYDPAGLAWTAPLAKPCAVTHDIQATPDGGAILVTTRYEPESDGDRFYVTRYTASGAIATTITLDPGVTGARVAVDISGRYIVQEHMYSDFATYAEIIIYSPTDQVESSLRIGGANAEGRLPLFNEPWYGVRLTPNRVYLPTYRCDESSTCTGDLYALDVAGLQGDYSRLPLIQ